MQCVRCDQPATLRCKSRCGYTICLECESLEGHCCQLGVKYNEYGFPEVDSIQYKVLFDKFHKENKGTKLYPTQNYSLNLDQLNAWVLAVEQSGCPREIVNFAHTFVKNLTYIGFDLFHEKLNQVAQDIRVQIAALAPAKVYALIGMNFRKSTTWVALLVWDVLTTVVTNVVTDLKEIPIEDFDSNIAIIHMDDMSYSGSQMAETIDSAIASLRPENHYFVLVPYLGIAAKRHLLRTWRHLIFSSCTVEIATVWQFLTWDGYDPMEIMTKLNDPVWYLLYQVKSTHNLIYFNHKLADSVSIPNKMLAGLYVADAKGKVLQTFHAIRGCEQTVYKTDQGKILGPDVSLTDFDEKSTCPVAFYKNIKYTFNGAVLENTRQPLLEILDKMQDSWSMCKLGVMEFASQRYCSFQATRAADKETKISRWFSVDSTSTASGRVTFHAFSCYAVFVQRSNSDESTTIAKPTVQVIVTRETDVRSSLG